MLCLISKHKKRVNCLKKYCTKKCFRVRWCPKVPEFFHFINTFYFNFIHSENFLTLKGGREALHFWNSLFNHIQQNVYKTDETSKPSPTLIPEAVYPPIKKNPTKGCGTNLCLLKSLPCDGGSGARWTKQF